MQLQTNLYLALVIIGAWCAINWDGMLLFPIRRAYNYVFDFLSLNINAELSTATNYSNAPTPLAARVFAYVCKPLFICPYCMSSVWTLMLYALLHKPIVWFVVVDMLGTMGCVVVLFSAINFFRDE